MERRLSGYRILVVEDEHLLARQWSQDLERAGAQVVGPAPTARRALAYIEDTTRLDAAIVDLNLRGELTYQVADRLLEDGIPFVFATGYDAQSLPPRLRHVVCCSKPLNIGRIAPVLERLLRA